MIVREPVVSGSFYPNDVKTINQMIDRFINEATKELPTISGKLLGAITPHAGYIYSGPIAGYTYAILSKEKPETIIVLAPSHRYPFYGISIMPEGIYRTPLGDVMIDKEIAKKLLSSSNLSNIATYSELADKYEHSLEVQIPFLQKIYQNSFHLVPIIVGSLNYEDTEKIGKELYNSLPKDKKIIVLASSDLSHFYDYHTAKTIDANTINLILRKNPKEFYNSLKKDAEACGGLPITILMHYASEFGEYEIELLKYANSGDTAGDKSSVVGYMSAIFYLPE
jgi:AmmeMemoRadiSam system protein B